jgi:hypothetical protein
MKKFAELSTLIFASIGGILLFMTPFMFAKCYFSENRYKGDAEIIEQLLVAVVSFIFWVPQTIVGLALLLAVVVGTVVQLATPGPTDKMVRYYKQIFGAVMKIHS